MQTIKVNTGFGYYVDQAGHKIAKAELPPGDHPILDGFIYVEVVNKEALDAIELWEDPAEKQQAEYHKKINRKIRKTAIDALKTTGDLPPDYSE